MGSAVQCWKLSWVALLSALIWIAVAPAARAQTNEWTWMGGSSTLSCIAASGTTQCSLPGVYGSLGTAAAGNSPGGRTSPMSWVDANGLFWLFGGGGFDSQGTAGILNDLWVFDPSTGEWSWEGGGSTIGAACMQFTSLHICGTPGIYGELGVPAGTNFPGSRYAANTWTDKIGRLWLFGGLGFDASGTIGDLNDLWVFDPSTDEWTWVGGSDSVRCQDCGQPGVYGTLGSAASGNVPGGRYYASSWADKNGNFWLFGGIGFDSGGVGCYLNDLWEFNSSTDEWTWMGGDSVGASPDWGAPGFYGDLGVPNAESKPGSRDGALSWTDGSGNLWLFAGYGFDIDDDEGLLNDVWEFNTSTSVWTWMGGSQVGGMPGVYGRLGLVASASIPGQRSGAAVWADKGGSLWLFGGWGEDSSSTLVNSGLLNDLWALEPSNGEWAWMGGDSTFGDYGWHSGVYGTLGSPDVGNLPGGRSDPATWIDSNGNFWLFGGGGYDANGTQGALGDLWEYRPSSTNLPPAISPAFNPLAGSYSTMQVVTIFNGMKNANIYYTADGTTPSSSSQLYSGPITVSSAGTFKAIAIAAGYPNSEIVAANYSIEPQTAAPGFSLAEGNYTSIQSLMMTSATPDAVIYYTVDNTNPTVRSTVYGGPITIAKSETVQAIAIAPGYSISNVNAALYGINLPPPTFTLDAAPGNLSMGYGSTGNLTLTVTPQNGFSSAVSFACSGLPAGASCSFSPTTVTPAGSAATTTLTVTAPATSSAVRPFGRSLLPATSLALALGIFGWKRRRNSFTWLFVLAACAGLGMMTACGGGGGSSSGGGGGGGSKTTISTVTVTATSGSLQQTASFNLTVN